ncbi:MAG: NAD(P)-dependent oxidoreductase [Pseudomonadota bacterium]
MTAKTILVTEPIHEAGMEVLHASGHRIVALPAGASRAEMLEAAASASALVVRLASIDAEMLSRSNTLEVVSRHGVGCDNIDVGHMTARGLPVAITADANAASVSEHALALLLAGAKGLPAADAAMRRGDWAWRNGLPCRELSGAAALVVGVGRVGSRVAALLGALGMQVRGCDPYLDALPLGVSRADDLDAALPEADAVMIHVPLKDETRKMFDAARLARLKPGALVVNCARGGIVDEPAMRDALASGQVGFYGTDVFDDEPPGAEDPLFPPLASMMTPHAAASTPAAMRKMAVQSAQNAVDALEGRLAPRCIFNRKELGL